MCTADEDLPDNLQTAYAPRDEKCSKKQLNTLPSDGRLERRLARRLLGDAGRVVAVGLRPLSPVRRRTLLARGAQRRGLVEVLGAR